MELSMAWNEPGNNGKNNDPWKQGGRNQGPPDLDEVFRNLGKKIRRYLWWQRWQFW